MRKTNGGVKLCECGCGQPAPIAPWNDAYVGWVEGAPLRFIHGHNLRIRKKKTIEERFWPLVETAGIDDCWLWRGCISSNGYGHFNCANAHRTAWVLTNGPIPDGLFVLHKCDVRPCCNPHHLFLGTNTDNMRDKVRKGRHGAWTHPEKIVRGSLHPAATITESDVVKIRQRLAAGVRLYLIAREFEVGRGVVANIRDGKYWTHVR